MTPRERVRAALRGDQVDRVPIAFWGHFASDPRTAEAITAETLAFQRRFDWDFVKVMPSGMYFPQALGCELTPASGPGGTNQIARTIVRSAEDWPRLPEPAPTEGWLGEHVAAVGRIRRELGPDVPIVQTLFSPLTNAHKLAGADFKRYVREEPAALEAGLEHLTAATIAFARATLDAGADGFFYATQEATLDELAEPEFEGLGKAYDLRVLGALDERAWFKLLHVCRESIMAEVVADYPVEAINWDTHRNFPSLAEAPGIWPQALVGGLDRQGAILSGAPAEVEREVRSAVDALGGQRLIVSAGCALPLARPDANLEAARRAVER
ncbi:MAG TPA: uroporphyrinogen decarboxylase family protein [Chloroflexota bacterium]|jgi:uroporphyrinogen decarboxylase